MLRISSGTKIQERMSVGDTWTRGGVLEIQRQEDECQRCKDECSRIQQRMSVADTRGRVLRM